MNNINKTLDRVIVSLESAEIEIFWAGWGPVEDQYKRKLGDVPIAVKDAIEILKKSTRELLD